MSRYRYRFEPYVTVFGPTLPNVTDRSNFTVTSDTDRNIVCFEQIFKVL